MTWLKIVFFEAVVPVLHAWRRCLKLRCMHSTVLTVLTCLSQQPGVRNKYKAADSSNEQSQHHGRLLAAADLLACLEPGC